ncbi:CocE/NonD family hydrolase [Kribbella sp. NPDC055071]
MSIGSHLIQRWLKLPAPPTRKLTVDRGLRVPMRDGVELLADHWRPQTGGAGLPTALIRTPYGRAGVLGIMLSRPLAERGFQVLIQSTRGGFGSGGTMDPFRQERDDGLDTIEWMLAQPWFGDAMVLTGASYLGYVQWAVADALPPQAKAMVPVVTESALTKEFMRADGVALEPPFEWAAQIATQEGAFALLRMPVQSRRTRRAIRTLPLRDADVAAVGRQSAYFQNVLRYRADEPFWDRMDHSRSVADTQVPVSLVGGWYDIFLPGQLRDFEVLRAAGRFARLTVGPWTHSQPLGSVVTESLDFSLPLARGEQPAERAPVRLYVMGEEVWRDFASWPPQGYPAVSYYLGAGRTLSTKPTEGVDRYRYEPSDPTPAAGGISMSHGGKVDNTSLEARADVLTYTTDILTEDVEVVGPVSATIWFRSSLPYADVFVRLCDVDAGGRSWNVCDGLTSVTGADELTEVAVRLWPTAYRFKRGHRIRVQVSSGAFPRYARNPGTGDALGDAITLLPADQELHFGLDHPSAILLPVTTEPDQPRPTPQS